MARVPTNYVNVMLRIKPRESDMAPKSYEIISNKPPLLLLLDKAQSYHFDTVFGEDVDQELVFDTAVKPLVYQAKAGYNCTVFAYGQTGTGKTYTMGTNTDVMLSKEAGIIPRTLNEFFLMNDEETEVEIWISFMEIYNEKVFDLLADNQKSSLTVKGFGVPDLKREKVYSSYDAQELLAVGNRNRHTGETKQNPKSSRSHAVFTIHCRVRNSDSETIAKLNLVDLAGSESVRKTGNQGDRFQEGININRGLLSVGQVMTALSTNSSHIPYRESIITTILQDSLNKRNYITLIACVSPNPDDSGETHRTLTLAQQVKKIKNNPEINELIAQYKKEHPGLFTSIRVQTPMKRSNAYVEETPSFKRPKKMALPAPPLQSILEPNYTASDCSLSNFSTSISSITSDVPRQNFSPVFQKYMAEIKDSFNELIDVIRETVQRPTRSTTRTEDKENGGTPKSQWDKIRQMVRKELVHLSVRSTRATSSPFQDSPVSNDMEDSLNDQPIARKLFDTSSTGSLQSLDETMLVTITDMLESKNEVPIFKVPDLPKRGEKNTSNGPIKRRVSLRLQQKQLPFVAEVNERQVPSRRRSTRLIKADLGKKHSEKDAVTSTKQTAVNTKQATKARLQKSKQRNQQADSQVAAASKRAQSILELLNTGNARDLQKLQTVGVKTSEMIVLFRELKGGFASISDLAQMPQWRGNKYQRFLDQNFLTV